MDLKLKPFDFAQAASRAGMADVAQRVQAAERLVDALNLEKGHFFFTTQFLTVP